MVSTPAMFAARKSVPPNQYSSDIRDQSLFDEVRRIHSPYLNVSPFSVSR